METATDSAHSKPVSVECGVMLRDFNMEVPSCCEGCLSYDWEWSEWHGRTFHYCKKNVWWPWKKGTCKRAT